MNKKKLGLLMAATVLGTVAIVSFTPNLTEASSNSSQVQFTKEELPASLRADSGHPDVIYVKDYGVFVKSDSNEVDYNKKEVVNVVDEVTDDTNVIVALDATYIKQSDWK